MTQPTETSAVVRRLLPAPAPVVYGEWLDPDALAGWMCPRPARCRRVQAEPIVGGLLHLEIEEHGTVFFVSGQYLVLDPPNRLSFSWSCSTWADPSVRSVVDVLLEPAHGEQTLMTITHTLLPPGLADQHARGWDAIASQLAAKLAALAPRRLHP
jgi:uncharacterized protein YndB with AHSA1/START domain